MLTQMTKCNYREEKLYESYPYGKKLECSIWSQRCLNHCWESACAQVVS